MKETKTETLTIERGDGTLTLRITYNPRTGKQIKTYTLKIEATASTGGCSLKPFVYRRSTAGAPMEDGSPRDEFMCVADALDEDEIPVDNPDLKNDIPYYRVSTVELLFRNSDLMYETARSIMDSLRRY